MGYSTDLWCWLTFYGKSYDTKGQAQEDLDYIKSTIEGYKDKLRAFAVMTEPKKLLKCKDIENDDMDPLEYIDIEMNTIFRELEEAYIDEYKLEVLIDNWEYCHDKKGKPIKPPKNYNIDTCFIDGDYI